MIAGRSSACGACLQVQDTLLKRAVHGPCTLVCPFGMVESAVPVRSGARVIGFLRTGQVFREKPGGGPFGRVSDKLRSPSPAAGDDNHLEQAFYATPVVDSDRYEASLGLLTVFAEHLASVSEQLLIQQVHHEPVAISRVKEYIREHSAEELSLKQVARAVNISASYLCRLFKKTTGINYNQYRARVRLEKAKQLLLNPNLRIGEIAYTVGFQSLTHFNRVFKTLVGQSPSDYRATRRGG